MAESKLMGRPPKNPKLLRNKLAKTYLTLETFDAIESYRQENFPDLSMSDFVLYCLKSEVDGPRRKEMLDTIFRLKFAVNTTHARITGKPQEYIPVSNDKAWEDYKKAGKQDLSNQVSPTLAKLNELNELFEKGLVKPSDIAKHNVKPS